MTKELFLVMIMPMWAISIVLVVIIHTPNYMCGTNLMATVNEKNDSIVCYNATDGSIHNQTYTEYLHTDKSVSIVLLILTFLMTIIYICTWIINKGNDKSKIYANNSVQIV